MKTRLDQSAGRRAFGASVPATALVPLLLLTLSAAVQAQDYTYTTNAGTINITGYTGPGGAVTIPDMIDGLPVTSIGDYAFSGCTVLTSVTIPNSVTNIGNFALYYCPSLTAITVDTLNFVFSSVDGVLFNKSTNTLVQYPGGKAGSYTVPNSVASIGNCAFACASLTSVTIPSGVTSIGGGAFLFCGSLTSVTIPNGVTSIGYGAFAECDSLTNIILPNSVTNIGDGAFSSCASLTSVTIPSGVTSIGGGAFLFCGSLTSVTIPNSVTSIGSNAFYSCSSLTSVTIPSSLTRIGREAFYFCGSLTSVTIPNGVTSIGEEAFHGCDSLTNITIPNSVTSIGDGAFMNCTSLTGVCFQGNAPILGSSSVFYDANNVTVYYLPGTTGWGTTFGGRPTALWVLPNPLILHIGPSFGVQTNGYGFVISWATNASVVVEACTDLANRIWSPVATNNLADGSSYFSDPDWTNYPARFYRLRSP